jgi:hypothetical protein
MDALIILQGLFLLNCRVGGGRCHIVIADTPPHVYTVGATPLPADRSYRVTLTGNVGATPFQSSGFPQNHLTIDSGVAIDESSARYVIDIPVPDRVLGASMLSVKQAALLNGTPANFLMSQPQNGSYLVQETLILEYRNGGNFSLNSTTSAFTSGSTVVANRAVLLLTSRPPDCCQHPDHSLNFNKMFKKNGMNPHFGLTHIGPSDYTVQPPEGGVSDYNLPPGYLAAPCSLDLSRFRTEKNKGKAINSQICLLTADPNGCPPVIAF